MLIGFEGYDIRELENNPNFWDIDIEEGLLSDTKTRLSDKEQTSTSRLPSQEIQQRPPIRSEINGIPVSPVRLANGNYQ